ncbi:MAG: hypothetical protein M1818_008062 [Claussenomyces sp. TS43310]|nr:MAG: hypothetical protein M1818_008062 [Claussenomyces sp. TS43310]
MTLVMEQPATGIPVEIEARCSCVTAKKLRHKSYSIRRLDSTDEQPSSHGSIVDAEYLSTTSGDSSRKADLWTTPSLISPRRIPFPLNNISNDIDPTSLANISNVTSQGTTPIFYGHGTALATIVEQNSQSTIRSDASANSHILPHPRSTADLRTSIAASAPHLILRKNSVDSKAHQSLRRHTSLSADDQTVIKHLYPNALCGIEYTTAPPVDPMPITSHAIYASPHRPILPPPERSATPPGYQSWTAAQNAPLSQNICWSPDRLQRLLGIKPSSHGKSCRIRHQIRVPSVSANTNCNRAGDPRRVLSAPSATEQRRVPRLRPPRSAHGAALEMHPFLHDPAALIPGSAKAEGPLIVNRVRTEVWGDGDDHAYVRAAATADDPTSDAAHCGQEQIGTDASLIVRITKRQRDKAANPQTTCSSRDKAATP